MVACERLALSESTWAHYQTLHASHAQCTNEASLAPQYTSSPRSDVQSSTLASEPEQLKSPTRGTFVLRAVSVPLAVPANPAALQRTDAAPALIPHTGDHAPSRKTSAMPSPERLGAPSAESKRTDPSAVLEAAEPQN